MAHKKGQGSVKNGRDSNSKRLGVKKFGGEAVIAGNIIIRQRGTKWHAGRNVGLGRDHTIFALVDGSVYFETQVELNEYMACLRDKCKLVADKWTERGQRFVHLYFRHWRQEA